MKNLLIATTLILINACASKPIHQNVNTYEDLAKQLVQKNKEGAKASDLKKDAVELIELAKPILNAYSTKNPDCKTIRLSDLVCHIVKLGHLQRKVVVQ